MNIKHNHSWLLVICMILGRLTAPTEGSELEWDTSVEVRGGYWIFHLLNISSRGHESCWITLYQQLEGEKSVQMDAQTVKTKQELPEWMRDMRYHFRTTTFQGDSKIVKATVMYPDNVMLKTKNFDVNDPTTVCDSGGGLEWDNSVEVVNDNWKCNLLDVPSRDKAWYSVTLYQKLKENEWLKVHQWPTFNNPPEETNISLTIPGSKFQGDSKVIMVEVRYPDKVMLESKIIELKETHKRLEAASMVGVIVGSIAGRVCLIAVVVGCILWNI